MKKNQLNLLFACTLLFVAFFSLPSWAVKNYASCQEWLDACQLDMEYCTNAELACEFDPNGYLCQNMTPICQNSVLVCLDGIQYCGPDLPEEWQQKA
jgi:hypothetical protein